MDFVWHAVPSMKSRLNKIKIVQVSYALFARSFSLMASGWFLEMFLFNAFALSNGSFYSGNVSISGFRHIFRQERTIQ